MHPETLRLYEAAKNRGLRLDGWAMPILAGPHHFHVRASIRRVAEAITIHSVNAAADAGEPWFAPITSKLPAEKLVLTEEAEDGSTEVYALWAEADKICFAHVGPTRFLPVGSWCPGSERVRTARGLDLSVETVNVLISRIAVTVSLINTPRKVEIHRASGLDWSRQHRKAVERVTGSAAMAFSVVSWELGRRCKAIGNEISTEGHPKALHWCRSHWREAEKGQPKAEWVNVPYKGGWGWYCWVPDCWKGHPDYGVKLQRHQPRMPGERPDTPQALGQAVLDKTRWEAMSAAHRAAMVEAGFAPSTTLH